MSNLKTIEIIDVYDGPQVDIGKKRITFRLTFQQPSRTLTTDEVDAFIKKLKNKIEKIL